MVPAHLPEVIESEQQNFPAPALVGRKPDPDHAPGGGILRKLTILVVIACVVGFAAWKIYQNTQEQATVGGRPSASGDRAIPIIAASVQQKTMPIYLTELGTVTAYYSVTIKTRVDGQLMAVDVREGQSVRKGQLLAQIDPGPYQAALAQAEGQLAKDKATAAYASTEADRYTALYNAGVVSQDSAQTLVSNAGQTAGSIQADQAAIQAAKVNLAYTRIGSPIDGVVGLRQVDPGNIVHAADTTGLILVTQLQPIAVIFTLPEDQLPQVQQAMLKGTKLSVEAYDRSETTHLATGKLLTLDNQIDTTTGTDKVKAVFDNKDNALFPNQFVNVRLILQQRDDAIVIPSAAVQSGSQGSFVYVIKHGDPPKAGDTGPDGGTGGSGRKHAAKDAGAAAASPSAAPVATSPSGAAPAAGDSGAKAEKYYVEVRPIVVDVTEGSQVIVASGLAAGERVVVDGQEKLRNNSRVAPQQNSPQIGGRGGGGKVAAEGSSGAFGGGKAAVAHGGKGAAQPAADVGPDGSATEPKHHNHGQLP
jgi:multidrug efflux system membrane fusion protein